MTVHFIGAGPGAPDLLTLRGRDLIAACPVCLYAGSLVPEQVLEHCPAGARVINTAPLSLDEIMQEISRAHAEGQDVARLHSGDLSVWSAMGEQLRRLRELNIPYSITPGVPSFAAAAATLGQELTLPGVAQSVVLTRTPGRASAMPSNETLANFARSGATLAIHLSIHNLSQVVESLTPYYGEQCPVAIVWRASWPDERVVRGRLATIEGLIDDAMQRTALIVVGPVLESDDFQESSLYAVGYDRRFRPQSADSPFATASQDQERIMITLSLIGIGTGNLDHVTLAAVRALNSADLILLPRKGEAKSDLIDLRRLLCERLLEAPVTTKIVEFDLPSRDSRNDHLSYNYLGAVDDWHAAIASVWAQLMDEHLPNGGRVGMLVWGDPRFTTAACALPSA